MLQQHYRLVGSAGRLRISPRQICANRCRVTSFQIQSSLSGGNSFQDVMKCTTKTTVFHTNNLLQNISKLCNNVSNKKSIIAHAALESSGGDDSGKVGGSGRDGNGGSGDNGKGGSSDDDDKILSLKEVEAYALDKKVELPSDMLEIAKKFGLRLSALNAYVSFQGFFLTAFLARVFPWVRDRLIVDPLFLFKVVAEIAIDSGCATVAEIRKRGSSFWAEFEFYLSDLMVGLVLDVALVSLMAPVAVLGGAAQVANMTGLQKLLSLIPSAVFQASIPGVKTFSLGSRVMCLLIKFCEYSLAGIACGFVGQGVANSLMLARRHFHGTTEHDVAVPPLMKTALVWGLFMGVSANVRYQIVFGLERLVDLTIARRVPQIAYGTTVCIRFVNNVIGGENFIDMARWAGVQ